VRAAFPQRIYRSAPSGSVLRRGYTLISAEPARAGRRLVSWAGGPEDFRGGAHVHAIPAQTGAWTRWRRGLRCLPPASRLVSERPWGKALWPMSADGASTLPVAFSARRSRLLIASPSASDMKASRRLAARSKLRSVAHPPNGVEKRGMPSLKVRSLLNSDCGRRRKIAPPGAGQEPRFSDRWYSDRKIIIQQISRALGSETPGNSLS
jgi:hypothetical protein